MALFLTLLTQYGYVALFFLVLAAGTYLPVPAGVVLVAVGALSHHHYFDLPLSFLVAFAASTTDDLIIYAASRKIGKQDWYARFVENNRYASYIEEWFRKRPMLAVALSRFVGFAHMPVTVLAGLSHMPLWRYLLAAFPGNAICVVFYLAIGYTLGLAWAHDVQTTIRVVTWLVAVATLGYLWFFFISREKRKGANQMSIASEE